MIDLTPLEVRKKREDFRRALRGYEPVDVDTFLDLVADRMEQLVRENLALSERAGRLEDEIAAYRERERALTDALVSAQEMREELRQQAARDAEEMRRAAEEEAQRLRGGLMQALEREESALREVRTRRAQLIQKYRAMLERELNELAVLVQTLDIAEGDAGAAEFELEPPIGQAAAPSGGTLAEMDDFADQLLPVDEPLDAPAAEADAGVEAATASGPALEGETEGRKDAKQPGALPGAKDAQEEDYSEGLDWLSSLLREDP